MPFAKSCFFDGGQIYSPTKEMNVCEQTGCPVSEQNREGCKKPAANDLLEGAAGLSVESTTATPACLPLGAAVLGSQLTSQTAEATPLLYVQS